jgi:beta-aspartyl-peptidase (threonine type)
MISLILHGGAWDIPDDMVEAHLNGVSLALTVGWEVLRSGGSCVDTVERAVRVMEDDETFDAGRGSHLNAKGEIELDASIIHGGSFKCGAVASVRRVKNPISLARKIMEESEHILLVASGAEHFAAEHGIELCHLEDLLIERERKRWQDVQGKKRISTKEAFRKKHRPSDTVGAVAIDQHGDICVGTSTGGTFNKYPGRVGDSPLIGCGSYADDAVGGVSTTGWGEAMIKVVMAKTVIDLMMINGGDPQIAADRGIEYLHRKVDGYGGVIVLNTSGHFGVSYNTPRMARAYINEEMSQPFLGI